MYETPRMLSRPMGVEWAGWRTDTYTLQQNGWELAVENSYYDHTYRLLLRHRMMKMYAITAKETIENLPADMSFARNLPVFHIVHVAASLHAIQLPGIDWNNFQQIDAQPQFTTSRITRIEDTNVFAVPLQRTQEIVIDGADMSVIEHLEAIKRLQDPEQQKIRERILREGATPEGSSFKAAPRQNVIAQIVSFSKAA